MNVQESQDQRLPPDVPAGQRTGQQIQCPLPSSSRDVPADHSCTPNTLVYTETDYLLPVALYSISSARSNARAPDAGAAVETVCSMLVQISVPFLLAGLGTVFTGLLLDVFQVRREKNADTDSEGWDWDRQDFTSPPFCIFMTELGCFPRDSGAANPSPCVLRHEREPGNDPGLQALDCCEPLFNTLMSENVLLESIMSAVTSLTICSKNYFTEPLTNAMLSGKWRKISVCWGKVEVHHR